MGLDEFGLYVQGVCKRVQVIRQEGREKYRGGGGEEGVI